MICTSVLTRYALLLLHHHICIFRFCFNRACGVLHFCIQEQHPICYVLLEASMGIRLSVVPPSGLPNITIGKGQTRLIAATELENRIFDMLASLKATYDNAFIVAWDDGKPLDTDLTKCIIVEWLKRFGEKEGEKILAISSSSSWLPSSVNLCSVSEHAGFPLRCLFAVSNFGWRLHWHLCPCLAQPDIGTPRN
jgi:hypothetical protein